MENHYRNTIRQTLAKTTENTMKLSAHHPTTHTRIDGRTLSGIARRLATELRLTGRSAANLTGGTALGPYCNVYTLTVSNRWGYHCHGDVVVTTR